MIRWKGLIDHFCERPVTWEKRHKFFQGFNPANYLNDSTIPSHIRTSFPKSFYDLLEKSLGQQKAWDFCSVSNETAPTTVRINPMKTKRDDLLEQWKGQFDVSACLHSPLGIRFQKKENFFALPEFKEGLFEVQDEASQLIGNLVNPKPTDHVLDYCAGSGGKTLALLTKCRAEDRSSCTMSAPLLYKRPKNG